MKVLEKSLVTKFKFNINLRLLIVPGMCNKTPQKFVGLNVSYWILILSQLNLCCKN